MSIFIKIWVTYTVLCIFSFVIVKTIGQYITLPEWVSNLEALLFGSSVGSVFMTALFLIWTAI